ncbi:MAG TPA: 50S ribosomal protein L27 [Candidatus Absconditabacterales bacterium]|nr:50S ribosomal protein L27 [Candidatus Absconditabacterales bacterium]
MAFKKAAGSAKNLRDSKAKYRGVKLFGGQVTKAGNIVLKQKGDKYEVGKNTYKGSDFSIHAAVDGIVSFKKKKVMRFDGRKYLKTVVEVIPQTA